MEYKGLATQAVQSGYAIDPATMSKAVPIYQTTAYGFKDCEHGAKLFELKELGNIYTRLMNPTTDVLEKRLAAMHGGTSAVCTASGMAAIFYVAATLASAGQNIVASNYLYGGTVTLFTKTLNRFGVETRLVDTRDSAAVEAAIDANTRFIYCETLGNPKCNVEDIESLAGIAHKHDLPLVVDNTVSPPPVSDVFAQGADIVVNSLTKMVGGHGTSLGGIVIERGDFAWDNGKFPEIDGPDESYHGYNFWEVFGNHAQAVLPGFALTFKIRCGILRDTGACISPFNAQQILLGVETLPLRAQRHCESARKIAEWLAAHPAVAWVEYPGLTTHQDYELAVKHFPLGPGALVGFAPKGGYEASKRLCDNVKMITHLSNLLDSKTLVTHNASTTHQQLSEEELRAAGVTPDFIRLSIGLEDVEDIKTDLEQALKIASA